jgi:hypothetical protein
LRLYWCCGHRDGKQDALVSNDDDTTNNNSSRNSSNNIGIGLNITSTINIMMANTITTTIIPATAATFIATSTTPFAAVVAAALSLPMGVIRHGDFKMTFDDFRQSLTAAEPPAGLTLALAGL